MKNYFFNFFYIATLILASVSLTHCGFKLRGSHPIPPDLKTLYFSTSNPNAPFSLKLRQALIEHGATLVDDASQAPVTFQLMATSFKKEDIGLPADSQYTNEVYVFTVIYRLQNAEGFPYTKPVRVKTQSVPVVDRTQIQAARALSVTTHTLYHDMIVLIINQLSSPAMLNAIHQGVMKPHEIAPRKHRSTPQKNA